MLNRGYEGEVAFLSEVKNFERVKCFTKCEKCGTKNNVDCDKTEKQWRILKGKYFMISGANITCSCSRSPNGIAPFSHLDYYYACLVVTRLLMTCHLLKLTVLENSVFVQLMFLVDGTVMERYSIKPIFVRKYVANCSQFLAAAIQSQLKKLQGTAVDVKP
ncbi:hypothetical protein BDFB_012175 [Asbolus verrucosus]|uniref:Ceramide kinase C-terminal domain-containing protein n=1 Tax=Asbolus verrucosus TaxID=1661398 RepID=A0A482W344_ASBVE|nr:hypothetical protein BDFB_012175 [Asbolus verrucosus]